MEGTIAAIATALGEGGIGIIRISGEKSLDIINKIFKFKASSFEPRKLYFGHVFDNFSGELIDEAMCVYMKAPNSYTAEDVVEIQCHGSVVSLRKILSLVLKNGAQLAEPGEFTKRAFLNGRLDLSQAEAVIDLIRAKSDKTFDVALSQLEGKFSNKIKEIRQLLVDVLVNITVNIDYPDEDIEILTFDNLSKDLQVIEDEISKLLSTCDTGRIIREGLQVAIIGKPNVGKSSLMNSLLRETRAIVTSIPGTTRDTIEESLSIRNIPVRLTDTAGIRDTEDIIEKIGIEKSKDSFNKADLIIFMVDGSMMLNQEDMDIISHIGDRKCIVCINKCDLSQRVELDYLKEKLKNGIFIDASMTEEKGIEQIEDAIEGFVYEGNEPSKNGYMVTNIRHKGLLEQARDSIRQGKDMAINHEPLEFLEIDVNQGYEYLGSIIGEAVEEDIINEVFARFCLGK